MSKKRLHSSIVLAVLSLTLLFPTKTEASSYQLTQEGTIMTCQDTETGTIVKSQFITHKGYTYYFDSQGHAHTGWLKLGKDYYFFDANGAMLTKQWVGKYYFQANGKMAVSRWINKTTYVGTDGAVIPGYKRKVKAKFVTNAKGTRYRNADGSYAQKTWQCINGHWYYFYSNGYMAVSRQIGDFYVNQRGRMVTNKIVRIGKKKYYYGADGRLTKTVKIKKNKK